ncbi:MAG: lytic transglycosylase domain-containing protein [Alphaproteobacteria bacterium]|nr:lytic transglycosylase domain-containing protein [Alphaproteobacteria bacterium]
MAMSKVIAACLMLASQTYSVPPAVMVGIYEVEGGKPGQAVGPNKNGSYDLGPMQINTLWIPELAQKWGVSEKTAYGYVKNDPCTNMSVAAWILRSHMNETRSLSKAIAHYHSRTPRIGYAYQGRVINAMRRNGLIKEARTR